MTGSPLRVLHVIEAMRQGGAESVVVEHVRHAAPEVRTAVCAINGGGPAFEAAAALGAEAVDLSGGQRTGGLSRLQRVQRLARLMRERRIDVVNAHNPTAVLYGVPAARLARARVVVRTEHSIHEAGRHSRLYRALEPWLTAGVDRVICVCEAARESHASRLGRWADRFVTVPNGVSPVEPRATREEVRAALGIGYDTPLALTVGSLTTQKAQHVLLDAFARVLARLPQAQLVIAGDGPLRAALERQTAELGLGERVRFLGARRDSPDLMGAADVFVLSSVREGLPMTILEAMRAALPVVATRAGGCPEVVLDRETGRLAPVGDAGSLADALADLLANPACAREMGEAGRRTWSERFTAERMVRTTETLYRELLATRG